MSEELLQGESPFVDEEMESRAQMEGAGPIHAG